LADVLKRDTRFWPVDWLILAYFAFLIILLLAWWHRVPHPAEMLIWHVAASAVLIFQIKYPNPTSWIFRNWYPVLYVAACYKEMADYLPIARGVNYDQALADIDWKLWGVQPAVWFERLQTPAATEYLQIVYTLFIPAVLFVAILFWVRGRYAEFQYYAFLIALGYLTSYIGYVLVPARGPRFLLKELQYLPLRGDWLFHAMQAVLDRLESIAYDCFPSGHTELTILACWGSRAVSKSWFRVYLAYTPSIIFATVYLRYHYTVDVFAGAILAAILIKATPLLYRNLH
jgi:membrane-associated phospholipid phosphatase